MGAWRPIKATPYSSDCLSEIKQILADAISAELARNPDAEATLKASCPSVRKAVIDDFKQGCGSWYGMTRLAQYAEGLRLRPRLTVVGGSA